MSDDAILAALSRLEAGQSDLATRLDGLEASVKDSLAEMRVDLMARMDHHANQLTAIRDDIAVASGHADNARKTNAAFRNDIQFLTEQIVVMERQIQRLQTDVRVLKGEP